MATQHQTTHPLTAETFMPTCAHRFTVLVETAYYYSCVCAHCWERRLIPRAVYDNDAGAELFDDTDTDEDADDVS